MRKFTQFIKECIAEMKKVVWPTRTDIVSSVKVVFLSTAIIAVILGLVDFLFASAIMKIF
ncbi:preprotein translocase subunit SecE [Treponema endosymbiont of Eucomonympha sp.]|uniref:preprotein translocase subunit SecE n=1 Tax=Treponema endosymbiont of Eucomonympha sp. TaxID=1580831 RepID=UPI000751419B|nr:preprotein translocase subunit SecE [Treponema endosymbiont of Eucomonympha sp.]